MSDETRTDEEVEAHGNPFAEGGTVEGGTVEGGTVEATEDDEADFEAHGNPFAEGSTVEGGTVEGSTVEYVTARRRSIRREARETGPLSLGGRSP
jgi:hypothetical protein